MYKLTRHYRRFDETSGFYSGLKPLTHSPVTLTVFNLDFGSWANKWWDDSACIIGDLYAPTTV